MVVWRLVSDYRSARSNVGEEVERPPQGQVEGDMAFSHGRLLFSQPPLVQSVSSVPTASGPFNATKFCVTLLIASSGIAVLPSFKIGVTSTDSHFTGTF